VNLAKRGLVNLDVKIILDQWAKWSRATGMSQSLREGTEDNTHWISDEQGLLVDSLVLKLKASDHNRFTRTRKRHHRYNVLRRYYLHSQSVPAIAKSIRCGETKVNALLANAENKIESYVECWQDTPESKAA
jgi:hypothetical protein